VVLTGTEIWAVYRLSRQGDPGLLAFAGLQPVTGPVAAAPPTTATPGFFPFFRPPHGRR
jgi:hypothetical protein